MALVTDSSYIERVLGDVRDVENPTRTDPTSLSFLDISYSVTTNAGEKKQILKSCEGQFAKSKTTAIMGPSGAGKTSLLNILAGRTQATSGSLLLNSEQVSPTSLVHNVSSYVQQDDCMLATQTCRETVTMAALLTLPIDMSKEEKVAKAEATIKLFGLEKCADTYIGDPASKVIGLSGGERKRTSIAMSCVSSPSILFLDEPTSGLDSFIALSVIQVMRKLNTLGVTVITTIHQPSSDIFGLFDDLLLLTDGSIVYHGAAAASVQYFGALTENSLPFRCPDHSNPADYYFMHVLTCGDEEEKKKIRFVQSSRTQLLIDGWKAGADKRPVAGSTGVYKQPPKTASSDGMTQFQLLLTRSFREATRNPLRVKAQFFQSLVFSLIISSIWWGLGSTQESIQDRNGVLFFMTANGMMSSVMGVLSTFGNERSTFIRDYENGLYGVGSYFLGKIICDAPFYIMFPSLTGVIMHTTVGLQGEFSKYVTTIITMVLLNFNGMSIGLVLASVFPDIAVALLVAPLIIMPLMMFSGFFLNTASTPVYFMWVPWISPMKYAFTAMARNEYVGLALECSDDELIKVELVDGGGEFKTVCPFPTGDAFLETFNIEDFLTVPVCHLLMFGMTCLGYLLSYLCLLKLVSKKGK